MFFIFAKTKVMSESPKKSNKGGKRSNCGRKPVADKKVQLWLFIRQSVIEKHGGKELLRAKLLQQIQAE